MVDTSLIIVEDLIPLLWGKVEIILLARGWKLQMNGLDVIVIVIVIQ